MNSLNYGFVILIIIQLTSVSGLFKMDLNGHDKSPQNGQVKEEKRSPTRIGLATATNPPIRGVSKLEESGDHSVYSRVPRSGTDQERYSSALGACPEDRGKVLGRHD